MQGGLVPEKGAQPCLRVTPTLGHPRSGFLLLELGNGATGPSLCCHVPEDFLLSRMFASITLQVAEGGKHPAVCQQ